MKTWYQVTAKGPKRATIAIDGEIGAWGVTSAAFRRDIEALGSVENISVRLNSIGGDVGDGVAIFNELRDHPAKVTVNIVGYAASIASVIAMAGDTVNMADNAIFMIHDPSTIAFGNAAEMRKVAGILDKHRDAIVTSYMSRDALDMDESELTDAMSEETWYTAAEARAAGFVDKVTKVAKESDTEATASMLAGFDMSLFRNAPEYVMAVAKSVQSAQPDPEAPATETTTAEKSDMEYSEAEMQAKVSEAVTARDARWSALLNHPKASNVAAVTRLATANSMSDEDAVAMMDMVEAKADPAPTPDPGTCGKEDEGKSTDEAVAQAKVISDAVAATIKGLQVSASDTHGVEASGDGKVVKMTDRERGAAALEGAR